MDTSSSALFYQILQTVVPLVIIVTVAFLYARKYKPDMSTANKMNIDVFVPALIFSVMSAKSFDFAEFQNLTIGVCAIVIGSGLLLWPFTKILKVNSKTFLPPMMFNNSGNLGVPLIVLAFGEQALPAAVIIFIIENLLHFTLGVYILSPRSSIIKMLATPMMIATGLGLAWSIFGLHLPQPIMTGIDMLGQIAIPLMLVALGVRMTSVDFSRWKVGVTGAILCPISGIAIALLVSLFLPLTDIQFAYLVVFGALPPAVMNFMLAEKYNQEPGEVASIVLLGNMGSLIFIPITLYFVL